MLITGEYYFGEDGKSGVVEIFNNKEEDGGIWEYYVIGEHMALTFSFGVPKENRFDEEHLRNLWENGYFDCFFEDDDCGCCECPFTD